MATSSDHGTESDESFVSGIRKNSSSSNGSNVKRRASRAGTRSVSTLTASQLERKRANDREAQRAIRQRTRDYIDHLEKQVADLGSKGDEFTSVMQRNAALEAEVAQLRCQLQLSGYCLTCSARGVPQRTTKPRVTGNGTKSPSNPQRLLHQIHTGPESSHDFSSAAAYASNYSPAPPSSTTGSISSTDFTPDVEPATSMDDRSIDATARLMAEAGFLLGTYNLSGSNRDPWDQSHNDHQMKPEEIDELMEDEYERHTANAFVIPADPHASRL